MNFYSLIYGTRIIKRDILESIFKLPSSYYAYMYIVHIIETSNQKSNSVANENPINVLCVLKDVLIGPLMVS